MFRRRPFRPMRPLRDRKPVAPRRRVPERLRVAMGLFEKAAQASDDLAQGRWRCLSVGTNPPSPVSPAVVKAMEEARLEMAKRRPKVLVPEVIARAARLVLMDCCVQDLPGPASVPVDEWHWKTQKVSNCGKFETSGIR